MTTLEGKKRKLPPKVAAMLARKRMKLQPGSSTTPKVTANEPRPSSELRERGKTVRLDQLKWKEVELPDRLDDYEGFFGLEEVDDVEIVRDAAASTLTYKTHTENILSDRERQELQKQKQKPPHEDYEDKDVNEESPPPDAAGDDEEEEEEKAEVDNEEEWGGFDSDSAEDNDMEADENTGDFGINPFQGLVEESLDASNGVDVSAWAQLQLSQDSLASLSRLGFAKPTAIQELSIPEIMAGRDVIGKASTGSGKTLAFGIPIFERILGQSTGDEHPETETPSEEHTPTALVLSPTRELAHQITKHLQLLASGVPNRTIRVVPVTGGLSIQKQRRLLSNADIVVGTPGRMWEVMGDSNGVIDQLKRISFLVVDEADRLLSEGHFKEVEDILDSLDKSTDENETVSQESTRQTLVFSATFHKGLQQRLKGSKKRDTRFLDPKESMEYLIKKLRFKEERPKFLDANPEEQMAENLKEGVLECPAMEKDLYLYATLLLNSSKRTIVFSNSIHAVRRVTASLQALNQPAVALHSHMPQKARLRSLERFAAAGANSKSAARSILIATDVAARGLDIPDTETIIHYHVPQTADFYVHRSGRTARAGANGKSIMLCSPEEVGGVRRLIHKVHPNSKSAIRSLGIDRRLVGKLKGRLTLAQKIANAELSNAKEKVNDSWVDQAKEDLGIDSEEERDWAEKEGRGRGWQKSEKSKVGSAELKSFRRELKALLQTKINTGFSERYPTTGDMDIEELKRGLHGDFIGKVPNLEWNS
ncbi:DEAD-domain-containing protein [Eremomyces bilateralis CBS 781.70]|uniref:RNA helicase n=1 Tax=Eremomyces bilateralis CBS 781.70 TaxID=1392243 RepID=A0A6G1FQP2_9PEZI|nr:DEAD-domain-containing protein [Eremomyces bilateralis CBS 781.70]KAF1807972.1 DEAD-domain-containing protein [Eremomyces bilateralis CBS 781.70]